MRPASVEAGSASVFFSLSLEPPMVVLKVIGGLPRLGRHLSSKLAFMFSYRLAEWQSVFLCGAVRSTYLVLPRFHAGALDQ